MQRSQLSVGQIVMLIDCDDFMPPLGAYGDVVGGLDSDGDHEVLFPRYPCPVPPGITWHAQAHWLLPITPPPARETTDTPAELEQV